MTHWPFQVSLAYGAYSYLVHNIDAGTVMESLSKLLALVELLAPEELAEFLADFLAKSHHPQLAPQQPAPTQEFGDLLEDFLA